jgi:ABC-type transport system involved in multi-copper enzyme maturation permease subunit
MRSPRTSAVATLFQHEMRWLLGSLRFRAAAVLIVLLMALGAVVTAAGYRAAVQEQAVAARDYQGSLAGVTLGQAAEVLHLALKPPSRLALVVDGGQSATPDAYGQALSALASPALWRVQEGNPRLPEREPVDWMFTVRVVLSLAAFLLGHDALCGERRRGTLKLLLSYPVPRWTILAGKLLATWTCLAVPLLAGALLSLLLAAGAGASFTTGDLARAGVVLLLGLWAAAFFALVALVVSALAREPATSLGALAWLWVTAVLVVPAVSGLLAHRLDPIPAEGEVARRMEEIQRRIARAYAGREGHWRRPEWAAADGFAWERVSAAAESQRFSWQEEVRRGVLESKLAQARRARSLAAVSPTSLLQDAAERLTGTGLGRDARFLEQARTFREALAGWLGALDAADPESPHILFFSGYVSQRPLPPGSIPRFVFREASVRQGLAAARPVLAIFAGETLALAAVALFFFSRYDAG